MEDEPIEIEFPSLGSRAAPDPQPVAASPPPDDDTDDYSWLAMAFAEDEAEEEAEPPEPTDGVEELDEPVDEPLDAVLAELTSAAEPVGSPPVGDPSAVERGLENVEPPPVPDIEAANEAPPPGSVDDGGPDVVDAIPLQPNPSDNGAGPSLPPPQLTEADATPLSPAGVPTDDTIDDVTGKEMAGNGDEASLDDVADVEDAGSVDADTTPHVEAEIEAPDFDDVLAELGTDLVEPEPPPGELAGAEGNEPAAVEDADEEPAAPAPKHSSRRLREELLGTFSQLYDD